MKNWQINWGKFGALDTNAQDTNAQGQLGFWTGTKAKVSYFARKIFTIVSVRITVIDTAVVYVDLMHHKDQKLLIESEVIKVKKLAEDSLRTQIILPNTTQAILKFTEALKATNSPLVDDEFIAEILEETGVTKRLQLASQGSLWVRSSYDNTDLIHHYHLTNSKLISYIRLYSAKSSGTAIDIKPKFNQEVVTALCEKGLIAVADSIEWLDQDNCIYNSGVGIMLSGTTRKLSAAELADKMISFFGVLQSFEPAITKDFVLHILNVCEVLSPEISKKLDKAFDEFSKDDQVVIGRYLSQNDFEAALQFACDFEKRELYEALPYLADQVGPFPDKLIAIYECVSPQSFFYKKANFELASYLMSEDVSDQSQNSIYYNNAELNAEKIANLEQALRCAFKSQDQRLINRVFAQLTGNNAVSALPDVDIKGDVEILIYLAKDLREKTYEIQNLKRQNKELQQSSFSQCLPPKKRHCQFFRSQTSEISPVTSQVSEIPRLDQ